MSPRVGIGRGALRVAAALASLALLVAILLVLSGALRDRIEPGPTEPPPVVPMPAGATVSEVAAVEEPVVERFPGTVQAIRDAVVSPRITAEVLEVSCRPGDRVSSGDVLAILDARDLEARAAQAEESLAAAVAEADDARGNLERMETAGATGRGAVSERELDSARARRAGADANVERARRSLDEARIAVGYATLVAPFDSVVVDRYVEPGDVASVGVPVCRVYDPSRMRLEVFVRESLAVGLDPGDEVEVELAALGTAIAGTVEEIVPQAEPGSRSLLVKVALQDAEKLYPGLFGRLLLESGRRAVLRIPERAVHAVGQLRFVELAGGARRHVTLGRSNVARVEVLSGLTEGESIRVPPPTR